MKTITYNNYKQNYMKTITMNASAIMFVECSAVQTVKFKLQLTSETE